MSDRIEQFQKMAEADPENEMGHFSLGKAYLDAGRFAEAIAPLNRTLELNPTFSKAYHLLGETRRKMGETDEALKTLTRGFEVADEKGDLMPRDAMAQIITELGGQVPQSKAPEPKTAAAQDGADFFCSRCGRPSSRMTERPIKGDLGEKIWNHVCEPCWREWIGMGTKVINELSLQLADAKSQKTFDEHMKEFLQIV
ncbi:MAG: tetratricopeptide repeat protein [Planctomycetes bacterium]|nr:tetratricopeptide repeat protein [Planctomycetota bacterium]